MRVTSFTLAACLALCACAPLRGPGIVGGDTLRLSELLDEGDPERRSSLALVVQGLDADDDGRPDDAVGDYLSALRVDPGNPWAYLALARHQAEGPAPGRALAHLDKCEALLGAEGLRTRRVEPHLVGLRGVALAASGQRREAEPLLRRAQELGPAVWADGALSAAELR
jgi:tetratricopeptide (TPR) repeat protein